jgi:hypothetical protein
MKKIVILLLSLLLIYSVSAFSLSELSDNIKGFITGSAINKEAYQNKPPTVVVGYGEATKVITTYMPLITWSYSDPENDKQTAYYIQYSKDDLSFDHPVLEAGIGSTTSHKIILRDTDGIYYIRVKAKDTYDWGEWSDYITVYLDTSKKVCSDGTEFYKCSINKPEYCDGGIITPNCLKCGCLTGFSCDPSSGICSAQTCVDNTIYNKCSSNKPKLCLGGNLVNTCSLCGCPSGQECQTNGECRETLVTIQPQIQSRTFFQKIADFFRNLF